MDENRIKGSLNQRLNLTTPLTFEREKTLTFAGEGNPPAAQIAQLLVDVYNTTFIKNMSLVTENDHYRLHVTFTREAHEGQYDGRVLP